MIDSNAWKAKQKTIGVGIMSGTSCDGIDVAVCEFSQDIELIPKVLAFETVGYPKKIRSRLLCLVREKQVSLEELTRLDFKVGELFANAVEKVVRNLDFKIDFIASHGHTVFHAVGENAIDASLPNGTLQIGEPSYLADRFSAPVIADFRSADMAVGGQGAPLIPFFDYCCFRDQKENRILLNIGGIANFTMLPAACDKNEVIAFDSGPGNMVIDCFTERYFNQPYDRDGALAAEGKISEKLLESLMQHPYFAQSFPKSTGREMFGHAFAEYVDFEAEKVALSAYDILATMTMLTATSIAEAVQSVVERTSAFHIFVSGGGAENATLMRLLQQKLAPHKVSRFDALGCSGQAKEAAGFALLGLATLRGMPSNLPGVTGAKKEVLLGKVTDVRRT